LSEAITWETILVEVLYMRIGREVTFEGARGDREERTDSGGAGAACPWPMP